jgi:hypothetical protein
MFFLWFRICAHLRFKPAPLLGFLPGHNRPIDGLGGYEDPGLDGFVFSGCGHGYAVASRMDVISGDSL